MTTRAEGAPAVTEASGTGPIALLKGVRKVYGTLEALVGLDLEIRRGEVLGLLGPNGAGKTTALRILCGLLEPDAGSVTIDGLDARVEPLAARRRFGYVPDGAPLYSNLSPRQHLDLVGRLHGVEEAHLARERERLLEAFELADREHDPVGDFSHGMRQKTALACAILPEPALLVLDEPLSGLDASTTAVIKELLRAWAARGGAVLYTSHLLDVVERVCDRMVILAGGRLVAEGTLEELRAAAHGDAGANSLEEVFRSVTRAEDPRRVVERIVGDDSGR